MARFNIEVELDWVGEEGELSIDEEIKEQVINGVKAQLLKSATEESVKKLDKAVAEKVQEASDIIGEKVDAFIDSICEDKIASMQIPYKEDTWSAEVKYRSMAEFVGTRYEAFLNKKVYDSDGRVAEYRSDAKVSINEYFINKYLQKELSAKVSKMIKAAKEDAEQTVLKTLEQNLKDQLAADTVKRLNIPKLLENLQQKAIEFEEQNNEK